MADLFGVTSSNGAKVTDVEAVKKILEEYGFTDVEPDLEALEKEGILGFWGYDIFSVYPTVCVDEGGSVVTDSTRLNDPHVSREVDYDGDDASEELLKRIQPYLEEELVIQCISHEKCRYPLGALEIRVPPREGSILYGGF